MYKNEITGQIFKNEPEVLQQFSIKVAFLDKKNIF